MLSAFAGDSNAAAKAKGLVLCGTIVDKIALEEEQVSSLATALISDAFKGNIRMQNEATSLLLLLVERGHATPVFNALMAGFGNKVAKVVSSCIQCLITIIQVPFSSPF
jgi:hypothetical protein